MVPYNSPEEYLFNLQTYTSSEAKKMWRSDIIRSWNSQCAYCGSNQNITLDHIIPLAKGGSNITNNLICCCKSCNRSKAHNKMEDWYKSQDFFSEKKYAIIKQWTQKSKL